MGHDDIRHALTASKGQHVPTNVDTGADLITTAQHELRTPKIASQSEGQLIDPTSEIARSIGNSIHAAVNHS
jgi:hypothetical protein